MYIHVCLRYLEGLGILYAYSYSMLFIRMMIWSDLIWSDLIWSDPIIIIIITTTTTTTSSFRLLTTRNSPSIGLHLDVWLWGNSSPAGHIATYAHGPWADQWIGKPRSSLLPNQTLFIENHVVAWCHVAYMSYMFNGTRLRHALFVPTRFEH